MLFLLLAIVKSAAVNDHEQVFLWTCFQLFEVIHLGVELVVQMLTLTSEELQNCFPQQLHHFMFPQAVYEASNYFISLPKLTFWYLFVLMTILFGVKWCLVVVLMCFPLMIKAVEHLLMFLLADCVTYSVKCFFISCDHF